MQQRTSLLLDLFPRDSFYLTGLNIVQTARDLLLPGGIHVLVNGRVQTGDQISSQLGPFVLGQGKCLLQQFMGFLGHNRNYIPRCNLAWGRSVVVSDQEKFLPQHRYYGKWRTSPPMFTPHPIGFVSSPYKDASEVPKGLGAKHEVDGVLKILPEFELGLTDIEGFSHLIVIWEFDRSPRLELRGDELLGTPPSDNRPRGATRSPRRPNPIGLTIVELHRREGIELHVRGIDMLDGTPILDIKPYLSNIPDEKLRRGWLAEAEARQK